MQQKKATEVMKMMKKILKTDEKTIDMRKEEIIKLLLEMLQLMDQKQMTMTMKMLMMQANGDNMGRNIIDLSAVMPKPIPSLMIP